jgi:hypothetical protein
MTKVDIPKACPTHKTFMVPHVFEPGTNLPQGTTVSRCVNLSCSILFVTGALEGFYTRSNGGLVPYSSNQAT